MARSRTAEIAEKIVGALGIDRISYERFVAWALCEHLVATLATDAGITETLFDEPDALKQFRVLLENRTRRKWVARDYEALFERVKAAKRQHHRRPITYEEYLKLLWQVPLACAHCGRRPPAVILHVDHILPASKGGSSLRSNLQFLCADDNLHKGNRLEAGEPWLSLQ